MSRRGSAKRAEKGTDINLCSPSYFLSMYMLDELIVAGRFITPRGRPATIVLVVIIIVLA